MESGTGSRIRDALSEKIIEIAARISREDGAHKVNVRRIINELGVTNRVFYNRFSNCDEVLRIVYKRAVEGMRGCMQAAYHNKTDFVQFCLDAGEAVLVRTFEVKNAYGRYLFEHDSLTEQNRIWWVQEIRKHYRYAREQGFIRPVDEEALCHAIWCFCRGFYADAMTRRLPMEETTRCFREAFGLFLGGILI